MLNATDNNEGTKSDRRCRCHWCCCCCCDSWYCFCVADAAVNFPCCCCCCCRWCCCWCCPCIDVAVSVILRILRPMLQRHFLLPLLLIMLLPSRLQHPPLQLPLLLHFPLLLQLPRPSSVASSDVVYSFYHLLSLTRQHPLDSTIQFSCWIYKLIIIVNTCGVVCEILCPLCRIMNLSKDRSRFSSFQQQHRQQRWHASSCCPFFHSRNKWYCFVPDHFLGSSKFVSWSFSKVMF